LLFLQSVVKWVRIDISLDKYEQFLYAQNNAIGISETDLISKS